MTLRFHCDAPNCDKAPTDVEYRIGVDEYVAVADVEADDEAQLSPVLMMAGTDNELHFCSIPCLVEWAFAKGIEDQ